VRILNDKCEEFKASSATRRQAKCTEFLDGKPEKKIPLGGP